MGRCVAAFWTAIGSASLVLAGAAAAAPTNPKPVMIGYMPMSAGLAALPSQTSLRRYSHVMLAFANPDPSGAFTAGDTMTCMPAPGAAATSRADLEQAVAAIHRAGAKALVSVGGGVLPRCAGDWSALLQSGSRDRIVRGLVQLMRDVSADGIDVDIEGALLTQIDQAGDYTPFIDALSAALRRRGNLLTCATASYVGGMVPVSALPRFDYVSIMSYDQIGPSWGRPGDEHSTYAKAVEELALWRNRGVPRDRLVLGLPFYGYGYGDLRAGLFVPGCGGDVRRRGSCGRRHRYAVRRVQLHHAERARDAGAQGGAGARAGRRRDGVEPGAGHAGRATRHDGGSGVAPGRCD